MDGSPPGPTASRSRRAIALAVSGAGGLISPGEFEDSVEPSVASASVALSVHDESLGAPGQVFGDCLRVERVREIGAVKLVEYPRGADEDHASVSLAGAPRERAREVRLSRAWRPDEERVDALVEEADVVQGEVASLQLFAHGAEVEAVDGVDLREARPFTLAATALFIRLAFSSSQRRLMTSADERFSAAALLSSPRSARDEALLLSQHVFDVVGAHVSGRHDVAHRVRRLGDAIYLAKKTRRTVSRCSDFVPASGNLEVARGDVSHLQQHRGGEPISARVGLQLEGGLAMGEQLEVFAHLPAARVCGHFLRTEKDAHPVLICSHHHRLGHQVRRTE